MSHLPYAISYHRNSGIGAIDNKRANIVLKALNIAVRNSRNVYFHLLPDDMVREVPNYAAQYLSEHPEHNPPLSKCGAGAPAREAASPCTADTPVREAATKAGTDDEAQAAPHAAPQAAQPNASQEKATAERATKPAAERRQNAAHGANRGNPAENHQAPEERKRSCDPHVQSEPSPIAKKSFQPSPKEKPRDENIPPLTTRQTNHNHEIKKLEASIEGATRGNWRDLRTVFNAIGLTPPKPSKHHR
jgi:hypothetical protein